MVHECLPSTSSLIEPNDGRRRLLDLDPLGEEQADECDEEVRDS
jgi:hypothetical protein